jgi:hypothetical protein
MATLQFIVIYIFLRGQQLHFKHEKTLLPSPVFYNLLNNKKQQVRSITFAINVT